MNEQNQSTPGTKEKARPRSVSMATVMGGVTALLAAVITGCGSQTNLPAGTLDVIPTATVIPAADVDDHLIQLIDQHYACINDADPDVESDYEACWGLLSGGPGGYQSTFNLEEFKAFWSLYNVSYVLYYCPRGTEHFVNAETYILSVSDLSARIIDPQKYIIEYSFASDGDEWKISSGVSIEDIRPNCESRPRIRKLELPY